ncbi:MAG TPA: pentapeptide repeat-containing protein [Spirochaetales bacterium]|nr:pentapeptide repeat-containing protein [Spirochaetales bacterium]
MYDFIRCEVPDCRATALTGYSFCADHCHDPSAVAASMAALIRSSSSVRSVNASGLRFEGLDLSGKSFYACSFSGTVLKNVAFTGCTFRMCFFDFCSADSCDFSGIDA